MSDADSAIWDAVRERCDGIDPGTDLVTPVSGRHFRVEATYDDHVAIRFRDSEEERELWREQFEVFVRRLDDGWIPVDDLPPGVEPYAAVATLLSGVGVDDGAIVRDPCDESGDYDVEGVAAGESPFLVPPEEARTRPERLHDDAVLLADALDRLDAGDPDAIDTDSLTDLYVLLSDVQREADRIRGTARDELLDRIGPDQELHGRFGTVRRTTREYRRPKDDETVLDELDERGIPREWVLGVDPDKLDVVLAVTDLEEDDVYDVDEQVYVQKTDVDESEKYSRLQGLADRIERLEGPERAELREDLVDLEARLDEALSA